MVLRFVKGQFHEYQESTIGGKKDHNVYTCRVVVVVVAFVVVAVF